MGDERETQAADVWTDDSVPPSPDVADSSGTPPPLRRRDQRGHRGSRSWVRRALAPTLLLALTGLVADIVYVGYGLFTSLTSVQDDLSQARSALSQGEVSSARALLEEARRAARDAQALTSHPGFLALTPLPDARAVDGVAEAAVLASDAAQAGLRATAALGTSGEEIAAAIFSEGRLDLETLEEVHPSVSRVARLLRNAGEVIDDDVTPLLDVVADLHRKAVDEVRGAAESAATADQLFDALPSLFGADGGGRTYLLAFQALGEARATGGLVGFHGALKARNGALSVGRLAPLTRTFPLPLTTPVEAADWYEENYAPQSALVQPQQANVSPNFPEVAKVLMAMFERRTTDTYDGVLMMDPVAMSELMTSMPPIEVEGFDQHVDASNVVDVLLRQSYVDFSEDEQNVFLASVIEQFWQRLSDGAFDPPAFMAGLGRAIDGGHLKIHVTDQQGAAAMAAVDANSDYGEFSPNVQVVFHNNYSANKVDYFLRRDTETVIRLRRGGIAEVETTVTIRNTAPSGPPSLLLGPARAYRPNDPPGMNRMLFNILMPAGSGVLSWNQNGRDVEPIIYEDEIHPVAWNVLEVPAGETTTVRLRYELDDAYQVSDSGAVFDFSMFPQPLVVPERYRLSIQAPDGYFVGVPGEDHAVQYRQSGSLVAPAKVSVEIVPAD